MRGADTITACLALAALAFAGCGDDDDGTSGSTQTATQQEKTTTQAEAVPAAVSVSIGDNFYKPKDVTIQVGQSVKWKNNGAVAHTVTSDSDSTVKFDSGTLQPRGVCVEARLARQAHVLLLDPRQGAIRHHHGKSLSVALDAADADAAAALKAAASRDVDALMWKRLEATTAAERSKYPPSIVHRAS